LNLLEHAKNVNKSFGNVDILGILNTPEKNVKYLPYKKLQDDEEYVTNKSYNSLEYIKKSKENQSTLNKIHAFECSLPDKLNSWIARGDQSCIRYFILYFFTYKQ